MPDYQKDAVQAYLNQDVVKNMVPTSMYNASNRAYPDVAAMSFFGPTCKMGGNDGKGKGISCFFGGGTSFASPEFAGLLSLLVDHRLNQGLPPLGFILPRLYKLAADPDKVKEMFIDVTDGNTRDRTTGCPIVFPATAGWDPQTGFGQPLFDGFVKHLGQDDDTSNKHSLSKEATIPLGVSAGVIVAGLIAFGVWRKKSRASSSGLDFSRRDTHPDDMLDPSTLCTMEDPSTSLVNADHLRNDNP